MASRKPRLDELTGDPYWLTPREVAGLLRIDPGAVINLAHQGELGPKRYIGTGKHFRLQWADVKAWADSRPEEAPDA